MEESQKTNKRTSAKEIAKLADKTAHEFEGKREELDRSGIYSGEEGKKERERRKRQDAKADEVFAEVLAEQAQDDEMERTGTSRIGESFPFDDGGTLDRQAVEASAKYGQEHPDADISGFEPTVLAPKPQNGDADQVKEGKKRRVA